MPQSKKKGRKPAHQNEFAFKHNPKSKLTEKILASPNVGVCRRCYDKIEWRKQYRKYKPLSQPSTCNLCKRRNVTSAYHTICNGCSKSKSALDKLKALMKEEGRGAKNQDIERVCTVCCKEPALPDQNDSSEAEQKVEDLTEKMEAKLGRPLKLREQKGIERRVDREIEKEKQRLKDERRRARGHTVTEAEETKAVEGEDEHDASNQSINSNRDTNINHYDDDDDENPLDKSHHDGGEDMENSDDEEDDAFLKAVGGKDKLLIGEAYQKMLLQNEAKLN